MPLLTAAPVRSAQRVDTHPPRSTSYRYPSVDMCSHNNSIFAEDKPCHTTAPAGVPPQDMAVSDSHRAALDSLPVARSVENSTYIATLMRDAHAGVT